ncbi:MAG: glycosyltransferase [Ginsengibacter sp.]
MSSRNFNNIHQPVVLVAPLDWGLGHATRCIPIIRHLIDVNCKVIIGADGKSYELLRLEFPELTFLKLPGYQVSYSANPRLLKLKMLTQIPKILKTIANENHWLKSAVKEHQIDVVISDNRYGLYNRDVYTVFITHQLLIKTGSIIVEWLLRSINYNYILKFNRCWIPDNKELSLAGTLSHPRKLPKNAYYLGPLSRLQKQTIQPKYDYLILLSGPEPQRTILESLMVAQTFILKGRILLVRGTTTSTTLNVNYNCEVLNLIDSEEVSGYINMSSIVLCRSGYTTIMDLAKLNKAAILIPTPGQTEQEYLATYLNGKYNFLKVSQDRLADLHDMLLLAQKQAVKENGFHEHYKTAIEEVIDSFLLNTSK